MPIKPSVLHVAAECSPFIKVGGLADVVGSLPQAIAVGGWQSGVILPCYHRSQLRNLTDVTAQKISLNFSGALTTITIHHGKLKNNPVDYWFIEHPLLSRQHPYSNNIPADIEVFSFFSYCVVELLGSIVPRPDILHCHDWHTGLIPTLIDARYQRESTWSTVPTVFTIHNLSHQGIGSHDILSKIKLTPDKELALLEAYSEDQILNILKVAILSADKVTTVSPTYAREIIHGSQDFGLAPYIRRRRADFHGLLNGIDGKIFNPQTDTAIYRRFSSATWQQGKATNKKRLRQELGLPNNNLPLGIIISRLTPQKGLDILLPLLPRLAEKMQLVILGQGETIIEQELRLAAKIHPQSLIFRPQLDLALAQKLYASADILLMPSRFEPCGLGQMISMRYGTIPLVRSTGGLKDSVKNLSTGFTFSAYSSAALWSSLRRTLAVYQTPQRWYTIVNRCLQQDFSWAASAKNYQKIYQQLL
ncbi:MAG: glycogen/starch synthase [Candidatus Komeilibacteria bacterium]